MTKVIDTYDPNGEELWDYHVGITYEAMKEIQRLKEVDQPVPKELYWLWDEHNQAWPKAKHDKLPEGRPGSISSSQVKGGWSPRSSGALPIDINLSSGLSP